MAGYFGIDVSQNNDMSYLIQAFRDTKQPDLDAIKKKKGELENTRAFWGHVQTGINSLVSATDKFDGDNYKDDFYTRKTDSSDSTYVEATSNGNAPIGMTVVKVNKLAQTDLLLSDRVAIEDEFGLTGNKMLKISIGEKSYDIQVEFNGEETNAEAMRKVADAINDIQGIRVNAAYVKDTPDTGIMSIMSYKTGEENQIKISSGELASKLGWGNLTDVIDNDNEIDNNENANDIGQRKVSKNGMAGFAVADASQLNSLFNVNGIDIIRGENTVDDVIDGMTFKLHKVQKEEDSAIILDTDIDVDEVVGVIQPLLDKYNSAVQLLGQDKSMRRGDSAIASLYSSLRFVSSEKITSVDGEEFPYLMSIGIEVSANNTLSITDKDRLYDTLKENPEQVAQLFVSEDSFVSKLERIINNYHGEENLIQSRTSSLNDSIDRQDDKYDRVQQRIDKEASNMEKEYTRYLESYFEAQAQMNYLSTMPTSGGASNDLLQSAYG